MKKMISSGLVALAFIAAVGNASAHGNLVDNGSFEADYQSAGTYGFYASISNWTANIDPNGVELRNNVGGSAFDGSNFIELDVHSNSSISQYIAVTGSDYYSLSFAYSPRPGVGSNSNGIEVFWNGASQGIFTGVGYGHSGNVWQTETVTLVGSGAGLLKFKAIGISDGLGGLLDAVSVTDVDVTAVPEPETYAMLLAGLGLMGFMTRRARKKAA